MQHHEVAVISVRLATGAGGRSRDFVEAYGSVIRRYGMLERKQEQQLARRWQAHRDRRATDTLVTSHLRLAAKVARRYQGYGLPLADLVGEANLGLVIAASRFEPDHDARFSTYALWWIKAAIHDYILRTRSLVKIGTTAAQRKLFFGLRREMSKFGGDTARLTPKMAEAIAESLMVPVRDVIDMDARLAGDLSLNAPVGDDERTEWEATLADQSPNAETIIAEHDDTVRRTDALHTALKELSERERRIFQARRLAEHPATLDELGCELGLSSERVRQIEMSAFEKVRRAARSRLERSPHPMLSRVAVDSSSRLPRDTSSGPEARLDPR